MGKLSDQQTTLDIQGAAVQRTDNIINQKNKFSVDSILCYISTR